MYLLCSHVERMLNLAGANQIFNEFQIMESVNIQPIFLKLVNWKPLHALMNFKCIQDFLGTR